jgi:hypothetical protein
MDAGAGEHLRWVSDVPAGQPVTEQSRQLGHLNTWLSQSRMDVVFAHRTLGQKTSRTDIVL